MTDRAAGIVRVVLVDDHPLVRAAVRQAITGSDVEIVGEAGTYEEAFELAESLRPDLILLDLDLPGRSGLELLRDLRPRLPDTRVVVLTVSAADRDLIEAVRLGAAGYLTKDITGETLLNSVRAAQRGELPLPGPVAAAAINELARGLTTPPAAEGALERLTVREREVLQLIAAGATDRAASATLGISIRTVEAHVGSILRRLGARTRADAARMFRAARASGETRDDAARD